MSAIKLHLPAHLSGFVGVDQIEAVEKAEEAAQTAAHESI
tara:strand:- start:1364 stop:1483 length:120 start_codon:yes stop_codon:yes gene_type:complete